MKLIRNLVMQAIKRQALVTFSGNHSGDTFEANLARLKSLMNRLRDQDVSLDRCLLERGVPSKREAPVTYVEILHDPVLTISMFVLREGTRIPLHDHPGMYGLLKVVNGRVAVKSYSLSSEGVRTVLCGGDEVLAVPEEEIQAAAADGAVLLRPEKGNVHEIRAIGGPAAFVDVLSPPYETLSGEDLRVCHYYRQEGVREGFILLKKMDRENDFWTDWAPYLGDPL